MFMYQTSSTIQFCSKQYSGTCTPNTISVTNIKKKYVYHPSTKRKYHQHELLEQPIIGLSTKKKPTIIEKNMSIGYSFYFSGVKKY